MMLNSICHEINNYFDRGQPKFFGSFEIKDGQLTGEAADELQEGQYFRISGSTFNDGVYTSEDILTNETFVGAVWLMAIPKDFLALAKEIEDWQTTYGAGVASPYQSESFGGYSYTKASAGGSGGGSTVTWQNAFASRLYLYRKIRRC